MTEEQQLCSICAMPIRKGDAIHGTLGAHWDCVDHTKPEVLLERMDASIRKAERSIAELKESIRRRNRDRG